MYRWISRHGLHVWHSRWIELLIKLWWCETSHKCTSFFHIEENVGQSKLIPADLVQNTQATNRIWSFSHLCLICIQQRHTEQRTVSWQWRCFWETISKVVLCHMQQTGKYLESALWKSLVNIGFRLGAALHNIRGTRHMLWIPCALPCGVYQTEARWFP